MLYIIERVYGVKVQPEERFVWNKYLTQPYQSEAHSDWILHVVYGFIAQSSILNHVIINRFVCSNKPTVISLLTICLFIHS